MRTFAPLCIVLLGLGGCAAAPERPAPMSVASIDPSCESRIETANSLRPGSIKSDPGLQAMFAGALRRCPGARQ
jgi:hypothetical protein